MSKRHYLFRFSILLGWMLLTLGVGAAPQHQVAHAASLARQSARVASLPPGYSLTVTESASTMTYGGTAPTIQAQVTVPDGVTPPNQFQLNILIDAQSYSPDTSATDGSTYTFTVTSRTVSTLLIPAGDHAVTASYYSISLSQTVQSAPITLTVQKLTPILYCGINFFPTFGPNAPASFTVSTSEGGGPAVDWQDSTYTLTFVGAQTYTDTNLTVDSSGQGTALTPPVPGTYKYHCTFHGTANFNAATSDVASSTLVVSANNQPTIKLYSNPTTIKGGQSTTLEIVVSGGPGLPTPTGQVGLYMGNRFIRPITLEPGGKLEIQTTFPSPLPGNVLQVGYFGDTVYAEVFVNFPLTNPPLSAGGPQPISAPVSTGTPPAGSTATPPAGGAATPSSTTANGRTTPASPLTDSTSGQENMVFWIALLVLLVLAVGGSGAIIVLRKRI